MNKIIKAGTPGSPFIRVEGVPPVKIPGVSSGMKKMDFSAPPKIVPKHIDSGKEKSGFSGLPEDYFEEFSDFYAKEESPPKKDIAPLPTREEIEEEYRLLKERYIHEGEKILMDAKIRAEAMTEKAFKEIRMQQAETDEDCAAMRQEALSTGYKDGHERGYKEGKERGLKEGYDNGFRQCKETLDELLRLLGEFPRVREEYFFRHEQQLYDTIFQISNKIAKDSFRQKEKNVIHKTLKELAKGYRGTESVKVTLSQIDVEKYTESDFEMMTELFAGVKHVEFEISKHSDSGTLLVESAEGIVDASVETQIRLVKELADGKYRNRPERSGRGQ